MLPGRRARCPAPLTPAPRTRGPHTCVCCWRVWCTWPVYARGVGDTGGLGAAPACLACDCVLAAACLLLCLPVRAACMVWGGAGAPRVRTRAVCASARCAGMHTHPYACVSVPKNTKHQKTVCAVLGRVVCWRCVLVAGAIAASCVRLRGLVSCLTCVFAFVLAVACLFRCLPLRALDAACMLAGGVGLVCLSLRPTECVCVSRLGAGCAACTQACTRSRGAACAWRWRACARLAACLLWDLDCLAHACFSRGVLACQQCLLACVHVCPCVMVRAVCACCTHASGAAPQLGGCACRRPGCRVCAAAALLHAAVGRHVTTRHQKLVPTEEVHTPQPGTMRPPECVWNDNYKLSVCDHSVAQTRARRSQHTTTPVSVTQRHPRRRRVRRRWHVGATPGSGCAPQEA
jgi:hypothetical protein